MCDVVNRQLDENNKRPRPTCRFRGPREKQMSTPFLLVLLSLSMNIFFLFLVFSWFSVVFSCFKLFHAGDSLNQVQTHDPLTSALKS